VFILAPFIPTSYILLRIFVCRLAGPIVQIILVFLARELLDMLLK